MSEPSEYSKYEEKKYKYNISEELFADKPKTEAELARQQKREALKAKQSRRKDPALLRKKRKNRRVAAVFVLIGVVIALLFGKSVYENHKLSVQQKELEEQLAQLKEKEAEMENELEHVNSDEYVEDAARSDLHMIKDGETMYIIREGEEEEDVDE